MATKRKRKPSPSTSEEVVAARIRRTKARAAKLLAAAKAARPIDPLETKP